MNEKTENETEKPWLKIVVGVLQKFDGLFINCKYFTL